MTQKIKLEGFVELNELLRQLPDRVDKKVLQGAVTGAIREGAKEIRRQAPRGIDPSPASSKYGPLHKNIQVSRVRKPKTNQKGAKITTGDAFWGAFYELGTRHQPARPWFGQAFKAAIDKMLEELKKRLGDGIEKEMRKLK